MALTPLTPPLTQEKGKVVFAGTAAFAVPALTALNESGHELALVLSQPARPAGRGRRLRMSPLAAAAEAAGLPLATPATLTEPVLRERLEAIAPDALVVVAYGRMIPSTLLALPRFGAINVHPSLLPRWRGAAPVERAMLAGDAQTGVSVMRMTGELDAGPVYASARTPIGKRESAGELDARLAELGSRLLVKTLDMIARGAARAEPQRGEPSYAERLSVAEARLDFRQSAAILARRIRAFNPRPMAWCECDGERLRLLRAEPLEEAATAVPGALIAAGEQGLDIATGQGVLRITELQRAGRKAQPAAAFARGQHWVGKQLT
jgi:methionyl-tRNA formyltransferase